MLDSVIKAKKKILSPNTFRKMKICTRKDKKENLIDDDLEKSESDSDSNNETESHIDNDEYDE